MMSDFLFKIWERGKKMEAKAPALSFEGMAKKGINKFTFNLHLFLYIYLAALGVVVVLEILNLGLYRNNTLMVTVHGGLILLAAGFMGYGIGVLRELIIMRNMNADISTTIKRRLRFYRTRYEIWMIMIGITVLMLAMAINMRTDIMDGTYRINRPLVFAGTMAFTFAFCYGIMKIALYPTVRELKAFLSDLEAQVRNETVRVEGLKFRWRIWGVILFFLALAFLILGILMAVRAG
jgi:hypothetical protein